MSNSYLNELHKELPWSQLYGGMPRMMWMDSENVELYKYSSYDQTEIFIVESDEPSKQRKIFVSGETAGDKILGFSVKSYGDWELNAGQVKMEKFQDRDEFDNAIVKKEKQEDGESFFYKTISMRKALEQLSVEVSLEDDISFNQRMIEIYGDDEGDQEVEFTGIVTQENRKYKQMILNDFKILSKDGNGIEATAQRGLFYLFFVYATS